MLGGDTKSVMDGDTGDGLMTSVWESQNVEMTLTTQTPGPGTQAVPQFRHEF